jgi:hypothetical protein
MSSDRFIGSEDEEYLSDSGVSSEASQPSSYSLNQAEGGDIGVTFHQNLQQFQLRYNQNPAQHSGLAEFGEMMDGSQHNDNLNINNPDNVEEPNEDNEEEEILAEEEEEEENPEDDSNEIAVDLASELGLSLIADIQQQLQLQASSPSPQPLLQDNSSANLATNSTGNQHGAANSSSAAASSAAQARALPPQTVQLSLNNPASTQLSQSAPSKTPSSHTKASSQRVKRSDTSKARLLHSISPSVHTNLNISSPYFLFSNSFSLANCLLKHGALQKIAKHTIPALSKHKQGMKSQQHSEINKENNPNSANWVHHDNNLAESYYSCLLSKLSLSDQIFPPNYLPDYHLLTRSNALLHTSRAFLSELRASCYHAWKQNKFKQQLLKQQKILKQNKQLIVGELERNQGNLSAGLLFGELMSNYLSSLTVDSRGFGDFLAYFHNFVSSAPCLPFNLQLLTVAESQQYNLIANLAREKLKTQLHSVNQQENSANSQLLCDLIRFWLGLGSFDSILNLISFCIEVSGQFSLPSHMNSFLSNYIQQVSRYKQGLIKRNSQFLLCNQSLLAQRVYFYSNFAPEYMQNLTQNYSNGLKYYCNQNISNGFTVEQLYSHTNRPNRRWDYEEITNSSSVWEKFSDSICSILESAYSSGQKAVEYRTNESNHLFRADFDSMMERNISTGQSRAIRSLLALIVRDGTTGRAVQTVEINMPHSTTIKELRRELSIYLKHPEEALRLQYKAKILRRVDFNQFTIRDAIIPLGPEPLIVTKLTGNQAEQLCSNTLLSKNGEGKGQEIKQNLYSCADCDLTAGNYLCEVCAVTCHAVNKHNIKFVAFSSGICHCSAEEMGRSSCKALDLIKPSHHTYLQPNICVDSSGDFLFLLSAEHGLTQIGTGKSNSTLPGHCYAQNSKFSLHSGGYLAEFGPNLMLRSPLLPQNVLLLIDKATLQLTGQRILLNSGQKSGETMLNSEKFDGISATELQYNSFVIEYDANSINEFTPSNCSKSEGAASSSASNLFPNWISLPTFFVSQLKTRLINLNFAYGEEFPCNLAAPQHSSFSLSIEVEGLFMIKQTKLGVERFKCRIKNKSLVLPLFSAPNRKEIFILNNLNNRLHWENYKINSAEKQIVLDYCKSCGAALPFGANHCSNCNNSSLQGSIQLLAINSTDILYQDYERYSNSAQFEAETMKKLGILLEKSVEEENKVAKQAEEDEERQKLEESTENSEEPGEPPEEINELLLAQLISMGFSQLHGEKALCYTRNSTLEAALQWLHHHSGEKELDLTWKQLERAKRGGKFEGSGRDSAKQSESKVREQKEQLQKDKTTTAQQALLPVIPYRIRYDYYSLVNSSALNITLDRANLSSTSNRSSIICIGCGSNNACTLYSCLDSACVGENVIICRYCQLNGNWNVNKYSKHQAQHQTQLISNNQNIGSDSNQASAKSENVSLCLGLFTCYYNSSHNSLNFLEYNTADSKNKYSFCYIVDLLAHHTQTLSTIVSGSCYAYDSSCNVIWSYNVQTQQLNKINQISYSPLPSIDAESTVTLSDLSTLLLSSLNCAMNDPNELLNNFTKFSAIVQLIFTKHSPRQLQEKALDLLQSFLQHISMQFNNFGWSFYTNSETSKFSQLPNTLHCIKQFLFQQLQREEISGNGLNGLIRCLSVGFSLFYPTMLAKTELLLQLFNNTQHGLYGTAFLRLILAEFHAIYLGNDNLYITQNSFALDDKTIFHANTQNNINILLQHLAQADLQLFVQDQNNSERYRTT